MTYLQHDGKIVSDGVEVGTFDDAYNEAYAEFLCNLTDYEAYGYQSAEEFLDKVETDDGKDNAIYYQ